MTELTRRGFAQAAAVLAAAAPLQAQASGAQPMDAVAMAQAVRTGKATASELVEAAITRLEKVNPQINAVAYPNYERARKMAAAGVAGPLAGVPTLIKDVASQAGLPFTFGSRAYRDRIGVMDAPYVVAVERSGVVSIGRSTTPELGLSGTTQSLLTGPTRNPWNLDHSVGGSSGGAAAAVAAGVVPVAHASDSGGSIRVPAAANGLVGLKPSRGRMVGAQNDHAVTDLTVNNCVSRTVRDTAAWFAATELVGEGARFAPVGVVTGPDARRLRIGVHPAENNDAPPSPDVEAVFAKALPLLRRLGHKVTGQPLAFDIARANQAMRVMFGAAAAGRVKAVGVDMAREPGPDDLEPLTLGLAEIGRRSAPGDLGAAVATLTEAVQDYTAQFEAFDVYMTPTQNKPPVPLSYLDPTLPAETQMERVFGFAPTWIDNIAGTPAITLPMGQSQAGLPLGLQFSTRAGGEAVLLQLAFELERELQWYRRTPPIWVG
ncbi:MAG: amidase family protein [Pseudomonadota bacterium]